MHRPQICNDLIRSSSNARTNIMRFLSIEWNYTLLHEQRRSSLDIVKKSCYYWGMYITLLDIEKKNLFSSKFSRCSCQFSLWKTKTERYLFGIIVRIWILNVYSNVMLTLIHRKHFEFKFLWYSKRNGSRPFFKAEFGVSIACFRWKRNYFFLLEIERLGQRFFNDLIVLVKLVTLSLWIKCVTERKEY